VRVVMRVALMAITLSLPIAVESAQTSAGAADPQLTATGSSFAGVALSQWEGVFNEEDGGDVDFSVSSSVIGLNDFCQQTVDFAATDLSYAAGESACDPSQVPYSYQYVPDVGGSLAFEYNLMGTNGKRIKDLVLNAPTLLGIFTGAINKWDDAAIQALNPGTALPNQAITAYYRSDPSGENYLLSDYFANVDPGPLAAFQQLATVPTTPGTPSATWASFANGVPPGLQSLVGVNGADAASQGPAQQSGGISYVETAYAKNVGLPVASVVNAAGNAVQPTAENGDEALQGATLNSDLTENLTGVFDSTAGDAYPLSGYSYLVTQCDPSLAAVEQPPTTCSGGSGTETMGAAQGAELGQFIDYAVCQGQSEMDVLGYLPLSPQLVDEAFAAIGRIDGATEPPPPTPANCANPTIGANGGTSPISAVGALSSAEGTTLSVSAPTVGDAWVLAVRVSDASASVSSVSGGGVARWTRLAQVSDSTEGRDIEEWLGPITKSGVPDLTVHLSQAVSASKMQLNAQEFTNGGASTAWAGDVASSTTNDTAPSTTVNFPTLAPSAGGELYVGFSRARSASSAGTTPGFTYEPTNPNCLFVYDPDVSSSVSPTANQQGGLSMAVGALIEAG
jgi:phosphate transport system substrate-binding protein